MASVDTLSIVSEPPLPSCDKSASSVSTCTPGPTLCRPPANGRERGMHAGREGGGREGDLRNTRSRHVAGPNTLVA